jgi:hypothetical protein
MALTLRRVGCEGTGDARIGAKRRLALLLIGACTAALAASGPAAADPGDPEIGRAVFADALRFSGVEMGNLVGFLKHVAATAPQRRTQAVPCQ